MRATRRLHARTRQLHAEVTPGDISHSCAHARYLYSLARSPSLARSISVRALCKLPPRLMQPVHQSLFALLLILFLNSCLIISPEAYVILPCGHFIYLVHGQFKLIMQSLFTLWFCQLQHLDCSFIVSNSMVNVLTFKSW